MASAAGTSEFSAAQAATFRVAWTDADSWPVHVVCCTLSVACFPLHVVRCMLSVARRPLHADSCVLSGLEVHLRLELRVPHLCHAAAERLRHIAPLVGARLGARGPALRDRTVVAVGADGRLDKPSKHTNTPMAQTNAQQPAGPAGRGPQGGLPVGTGHAAGRRGPERALPALASGGP